MGILDKQNYYFIGIGGIGISALARMFAAQDKKVSGSDSEKSEITDDLKKLGIKINIGQKAENIPADTEAVIYTVAIPEDNPEMQEARRRAKSIMERTSAAKRGQESGMIDFALASYPEALGELSKQMYTIAISGTHGKTTTTAMIGHIMKKAGLDPSIIVGSKMLSDEEKVSGNFTAGRSQYLVVEACEYRRSFLNLWPKILVITNIEAEHLDYYKDLDDIKEAFRELAEKTSQNDGLVIKEADYKKVKTDFELLLPGQHNIANAQAAIRAVAEVGISPDKAKECLKDFKGTWRRLEYKGEANSHIFYDDYAHHPSEIRASLSALREKHPDRKLLCVFMPHTQKRTKLLFQDFVSALQTADEIRVAPIYVTREKPDDTISNQILSEALNKKVGRKISSAVASPAALKKELAKKQADKPLCVVMMGAGNIYEWTPQVMN